jgi:hypothetical protein
MQSDGLRILATIAALKLLVGKLYADQLQRSGMTLDEIHGLHDNLAASFSRDSLTFAGNPQPSDHLSELVGTEIREILRGVEAVLETADRQKKNG